MTTSTTPETPDSISVAASTVLVHEVYNRREAPDHYVVIGEVRASSWIVRRLCKDVIREQTGAHTSRVLSVEYGPPTGDDERVAKDTLKFRGHRSCEGGFVTLAHVELRREAAMLRRGIEAALNHASIDALRAAAAALGVA